MRSFGPFSRFLVLLGSVLFAATGAVAAPKPNLKTQVHTIRNDRGGQVINYALRMLKMRKRGDSVKVAGRCDSACTLFLAMPSSKICITPGATFRFHRPYGASPRGNEVAAQFMMKQYPGWVRSWIRANGGLKSSITTMTYRDASRYLRTCPGTSVRTASVTSSSKRAYSVSHLSLSQHRLD